MSLHQADIKGSPEEKLSDDIGKETLQKTAEVLEQTAGLYCWKLHKHLSSLT